MSVKHSYVYKLTEKATNKFYYGYRPCVATRQPLEDLGVHYFSSGQFRTRFKQFPELYQMEIIDVFEEKLAAFEFEQRLIEQYFKDPYCANKHFDRSVVNGTNVKLKESIQFDQKVLNLSTSKRRKAMRKAKNTETRRRKKVAAYERNKKYYTQYCDLETRAIVYIIP